MWWGDVKTLNIWKKKTEKDINFYDYMIEDLELSKRSYNGLGRADCYTVGAVIERIDEGNLSKIKGLGTTSIEEIINKVTEFKKVKLKEA